MLLDRILLPSTGFLSKVLGKRQDSPYLVGQQARLKEADIFGKIGNIRGYNSERRFCWTLFCIKGFNSNTLFQISHDYETKNVHHSQSFGLNLSRSY